MKVSRVVREEEPREGDGDFFIVEEGGWGLGLRLRLRLRFGSEAHFYLRGMRTWNNVSVRREMWFFSYKR